MNTTSFELVRDVVKLTVNIGEQHFRVDFMMDAYLHSFVLVVSVVVSKLLYNAVHHLLDYAMDHDSLSGNARDRGRDVWVKTGYHNH